MPTRLSGTLRVTDRVVLQRTEGPIEVITLPLQTSIGWEEIVRQSVEAFRCYDGKDVTLEGDLHGGLLASARIVVSAEPRSGVYRGTLEPMSGEPLLMELRFEPQPGLVSADLFRSQNYYASLRASAVEANGKWTGAEPRVIFDWQNESVLGGSIEIEAGSDVVLHISLILPEAIPMTYNGSVSFESETFRSINIEVDKLDGLPWPPVLSTADIPADQQKPDLEEQTLSLEALFGKAGIKANVQHNDGALDDSIGQLAGRPWEADRWDEREMHELMEAYYSRSLSEREWWLYLLVVPRFDGGPRIVNGKVELDDQGRIRNDGEGVLGIIFDSRSGAILDPWTEILPYVFPQHRHLFDFGRPGSFWNVRARQGVSVFWGEFEDFFANEPMWDQQRRFLRTMVHELGHALNLAHTWLVNRADSTSFMQYPQNYPHGDSLFERDRNYWRACDYTFDPEELFHFRHGFYNELIPGGRLQFMDWTPSSVFRDPTAGGTRSNLMLTVAPGRPEYRFAEPVTFDVHLKNHGVEEVPIGHLSPAFGNVRYVLRKPDGSVMQYQPPLYKCEARRGVLARGEEMNHTTSLTFGATGFTFDAPGRYEITAVVPDPLSGVVVVSRPSSFWVRYPEADDEGVARHVFDGEAGMFLYMAGGEHLEHGKKAMQEVAAKYTKHPMSAHANLVLGVNAMNGQKRFKKKTEKHDMKRASDYLSKAQKSGHLPKSLYSRLAATIDLCNGSGGGKAKARGRRR